MYDHYMLTRSAEDAYFYKIDREKQNKRLSNAIKTLSKEDRRLIRKAFWRNKSIDGISEEMGISPSEVEERLKAIYAVLKEFLKEE